MTIEREILKALKKFPKRGGVPFAAIAILLLSSYKRKSIYNGIDRLKKKNHIEFEGRHMSISAKGNRYLAERRKYMPMFATPFPAGARKNLIVIFDIPENQRAEREWFRKQLRQFGYEMIQKSVWFGPSPLPKEFVEYVKTIGLQDTIKMFKVSRSKLMKDTFL